MIARPHHLAAAGALAAALALSGPAGAACAVTVAWSDDGTAETTLDLDFRDDTAVKSFWVPKPVPITSGMQVHLASATAYGGCGSYRMFVGGVFSHTFDTCEVGWQQQPITVPVVGTTLTVEIEDADATWATGIVFGVDTAAAGSSTMAEDGTPVDGELMWRIGVACV